MSRISKAIVAGVAALSLSASVLATATPAEAQWRGYGWHGGGYGWHGGGWRGGGYGWRGGGYGWHHRGGGWYWGPALAAGLATGAIIATAPYWNGGGNCWQNRPVYDAYGNWLGNQTVNVCY